MAVVAGTLGAWLLTYLLHSTLLLGGVALLTRLVARREAVREALWKAALVGGVVTATLSVALPRPGRTVQLAVLDTSTWAAPRATRVPSRLSGDDAPDPARRSPASRGAARASTAGPAGPAAGFEGPGDDIHVDADIDADVDADTDADLDADLGADHDVDAGGPAGSADGRDRAEVAGGADLGGRGGPGGPGAPVGAGGWLAFALAGWALMAGALLARLAYRHGRLRWLLRDRREVPGTAPAAVALSELRRGAGVWRPVRLTTTPVVGTPLALGGVEVCVPERFLSELSPAEQRAALAHELAHLARRDPAWQVAGSVIAALFFFQPLNWLARRRIRASAEYLADGWAVDQTGSEVELARCLASVAGWVAPVREPALAGTVAMAEGGSPLLARVQRLLEQEPEAPARPAFRLALAVGLVVVAGAFAPAVGPEQRRAPGVAPGESAGEAVDESGAPGGLLDRIRDGVGEGVREGVPEALEEGLPEALGEADWRAGDDPARAVLRDVRRTRDLVGDGAEADSDVDRNRDQNAAEQELGGRSGQEPLEVFRFDRPGADGDGFVARLNEAGRDAGQRPYWVAYAIPTGASEGGAVVSDTEPWVARELRGEPLERKLGVSGELVGDRLLVLVRLEPLGAATRVDRITVRDPRLGMRLGGRVYWLGGFAAAESFPWLRDIYRDSRNQEIRSAAVEALSFHETPGTAAFLRRVLESREAPDVREDALEGLASVRRDPEIARLLFDVAMNDEDGGVRHEATERLADVDDPALAVELLERLANGSPDDGVQRQAAESLGEVGTPAARDALRRLLEGHPSTRVKREALDQLGGLGPSAMDGETLLGLALTADDPDVRREAVEMMEDLPPDDAAAMLARAAFESGDRTVARQAAETLGDMGTEAALAVLVAILERNPGEDASFQAVEAVAENYPRSLSLPILRRVVREHPSSRVRREALDHLEDLSG